MSKTDFLQAKATYLIAHPAAEELAFCQQFVADHPEQAIGWLHLGREWEKRGDPDRALAAYRRALHARDRDGAEEARDAYQQLLRNRQTRRNRLRHGVLLSLLLLLVLLPTPLRQNDGESRPAATAALSFDPTQRPVAVQHTEVISVPDRLSGTELSQQMERYLKSRRSYYNYPFTVIAVPEAQGIPLFTPLVFYHPGQVRGVVFYDAQKDSILTQKWFSQRCSCEQDPLVSSAKRAFQQERIALEQALILRNALFRTYQLTGRLPGKLSDLAAPFPANVLSSIPQLQVPDEPSIPSKETRPKGKIRYQDWSYHPESIRPESAWQSMSAVLPIPFYPEPAIPLGPLQIFIQQDTFTLLLTSGPHPVRRYRIGVGKEERTPEGYFSILKKISQPKSPTNAYGTRGIVFTSANHAIHGTNKPQSIGQEVSLGCIRLHNGDVEELFSFTSPGTEVIISNKPHPPQDWRNPPRHFLPVDSDEETPGVVYHWLQ